MSWNSLLGCFVLVYALSALTCMAGSYDQQVWTQAAGETVFAPFGAEHADSPHLGPTGWTLRQS